MKKEKSEFNNQSSELSESKTTKSQKKPYKSPILVEYGTVSKLTQGTRSKGVEGARKQT